MAQVQPNPPVAPIRQMPWVDPKTGMLTATAQQFLQQLFSFVVGTSRLIPCQCSNVGNLYTLTLFGIGPVIKQYQDYDTFMFNASAGSTGAVTANVVTAQGDKLATQTVYTQAGAPVGAGGIANNVLYMLSYSSGYPGLVLR